nr:hypothetical protein Iba_chr01cCG3380 [Ipomoea batatas]
MEVIRISSSIRSVVVTSSPAIMVLQFAAVTDDMIFTYSDPLLISLLTKLAARVYAQNPTKSSSLTTLPLEVGRKWRDRGALVGAGCRFLGECKDQKKLRTPMAGSLHAQNAK